MKQKEHYNFKRDLVLNRCIFYKYVLISNICSCFEAPTKDGIKRMQLKLMYEQVGLYKRHIIGRKYLKYKRLGCLLKKL